jgi:hypothetical protein
MLEIFEWRALIKDAAVSNKALGPFRWMNDRLMENQSYIYLDCSIELVSSKSFTLQPFYLGLFKGVHCVNLSASTSSRTCADRIFFPGGFAGCLGRARLRRAVIIKLGFPFCKYI